MQVNGTRLFFYLSMRMLNLKCEDGSYKIVAKIKNEFVSKYPTSPAPDQSTVSQLYSKFRETDSVMNQCRQSSITMRIVSGDIYVNFSNWDDIGHSRPSRGCFTTYNLKGRVETTRWPIPVLNLLRTPLVLILKHGIIPWLHNIFQHFYIDLSTRLYTGLLMCKSSRIGT